MSDVQNTTATAEQATTEPTTVQQPETTVAQPEPSSTDIPAAESKPEEPTIAQQTTDAAPAEEKKDELGAIVPEKVIEPITEGQLTYKGPGLLKSLIPSKKDFWVTDEPTTSQELSSYMRGEKPDIAHPVVAWASQTGKGLLFFNKKGDTNRKQPGHVLALYDATELRKRNPQEICFAITGHEHVLKAATDAERDGWYLSIEKAVEMGKAVKEEIRESEGYKEELEKLNKPHVSATMAAVASKRGQSQPKKSSEGERPNSEGEEEQKKDKKARSTSRGVLNRFKSKKEEPEAKKEEKDADKDIAKPDEENKTEEAVVVGAGAAGAAGVAGVVAAEEEKKDSTESPVEASKTEEKSKPAKRGSIFGKMAGWGGMKSPSKEKDAELKPEVPAKDGVSEEAPILPETATTERTDPEVEADKIEAKAEKEVELENQVEEPKKEATTPAKEKSGFLSGFLPKRNRSVSPSANLTDKAEPEVAKDTTDEVAKPEEPAAEPAVVESTEKAEEPAKTETTTANKRQSMLGSLGRRASKAMSGMRGGQKKDTAAPGGDVTKEEATEEAEKPIVNGEAQELESDQPIIGDVVPSAISVGPSEQPATVTASA